MNNFIIKYFPSLWVIGSLGLLLLFIAGFNSLMAGAIGSDDVVYNGQCTIDYGDMDDSYVDVICGEYINTYNSARIIKQTVMLKRTPTCVVKRGSLTENLTFVCEYTSTE